MKQPSDPEQYLDECVAIEPLAIEEEFIRVPSDLAYWNARYSDVYLHYHTCKLTREQVFHRLYEVHSDRLRALSGKATVDQIKAAAEQDPEYTKAKTYEITADAERVRLSGVLDSIRSKRDMLISLGAHTRFSEGRDPSIRQQSYLDRES